MRQLIPHGGTKSRFRALCAIALLAAGATLLADIGQSQSADNHQLVPTIAFSSVQDKPCLASFPRNSQVAVGEIYLMGPNPMNPDPDPTNVQRLTDNDNCTHGDAFATLSGDGKKIVFDSNRLRSGNDPLNTSDLFVMDVDGSNQKWLIRGSSANWSPALAMNGHGAPGKRQIVFHASASGMERPIRPDPGAPTFDSDLFLLNVDDCLQYLYVQFKVNCRDLAADITKDLQPHPSLAPNYNDGQFSPPNPPAIHEDADWSPDGTKIVFTSHPSSSFCGSGDCNYPLTEIYTINTDGTELTQLTHNLYEERAPAWSPDGKHIAFMCRIGPVNAQSGLATFELCVIDTRGDAYGTIQLTQNNVLDATPSWSPDGTQIVFHKNLAPPFQLWVVKAKWICEMGSCTCQDQYPTNGLCEVQLTTNTPKVMSGFPHWGVLRVRVPKQ